MASAIPSPPPNKRPKWAQTEAQPAPNGHQNDWQDQNQAQQDPSLPAAPIDVHTTSNSSNPSNGITATDSGFSDATGEEESQESFAGPSGLQQQQQQEQNRDGDEDDDDDNASEISGMSDLSGAEWKSSAGPISWVQNQMLRGADPRVILQDMLSEDTVIPADLDQLTLWKIIINMLSEPPRRQKLDFVNTIENVAELIKKSSKILVLTGAGVSVSCGIPDFRSKDGVYARLAVDFPNLPDPQAMFDIHYFRKDPRPFFKFAKEIYPGQFKPSPCHRFIRNLEKQGRLLRNYTQNIDTLEQQAGLENVVQCHGSFATATCTKCPRKVDAEVIREDIFQQRIPYCTVCQERIANLTPPPHPATSETATPQEPSPAPDQEPSTAHASESAAQPTATEEAQPSTSSEPSEAPGSSSITMTPLPPQPGIMKPDIVFFGEGLGDEFHNSVAQDKQEVDLLIMIGSSLKVRPVALIPSSIPTSVPQILINREPLPHLSPDVQLLGDCDSVVNQLSHILGDGWTDAKHTDTLKEVLELRSEEDVAAEMHRAKKNEEKSPSSTTQLNGDTSNSDNKPSEKPSDSQEEPQQTTSSEEKPSHSQEEPQQTTSSEEQPADSLEEHEKLHQHLPSDPKPDPSDWHPRTRPRLSLSARLPDGSYFFRPPSTYVFPGAEVYEDEEEDEEEDNSSNGSYSDEEQEPPNMDTTPTNGEQTPPNMDQQTPPNAEHDAPSFDIPPGPSVADMDSLEPSIEALAADDHELLHEDVVSSRAGSLDDWGGLRDSLEVLNGVVEMEEEREGKVKI